MREAHLPSNGMVGRATNNEIFSKTVRYGDEKKEVESALNNQKAEPGFSGGRKTKKKNTKGVSPSRADWGAEMRCGVKKEKEETEVFES